MKNSLNQLLNKLNEEGEPVKTGDVSGVTKQKTGLGTSADFDKMPANLKKMWREYEQAGGDEYDNVWEFLEDVVAFLTSKKYTGRTIATWDKKIEKNKDLE